ncbi:MAG: hypothetical protein ABJF23_32140 [Bryobacteraceae bacterium]
MTASDYVKEYNSITVPGFVPLSGGTVKLQGLGVIYAPVLEYSNVKHNMYSGHTWSEREEFKDHVAYSFFPRGLSSPTPM